MRTSFRRLPAALVLGALILLLGACGSMRQEENTTGAAVSQQPTPTQAIATQTQATEPTTEPSATAAPSATSEPAATPAAAATAEPGVGSGAVTEASSETAVAIQLFSFKPDRLTVAPGTRVVWTNEDDIVHSVTHGTAEAPGDAFDSGLFEKGQSFEHIFSEAGEFAYYCTRHPSMQGVVVVETP